MELVEIVSVISIIIVLIIGLILLICLPRPTVFYEKVIPIELFSDFENLRSEIISYINNDKPIIPLKHNYSNQLPLLHKYIQELSRYTTVYHIGIIKLPSKFNQQIQQHTRLNSMLRCILCLDHSTYYKTGISVDGQKRFFNTGKWVIYDASKVNFLFNVDNYETTTLLWIDFDRKNICKNGICKINCDELIDTYDHQ